MYVYIHMCVFVYVYIDTRCFWVGRVVLLWGWSRKAFPSPCQWAAYYMKFTSRFHAFHFIQQSTASKSSRNIFKAIVLQTHHVHFVRHSPETHFYSLTILHSHSYRKHQSDLSSQPQTFKRSQNHQNTQTGSTSPFMVTSETSIKSKVRCYNHSTTHAYAHTSHIKTQAEGGGT